ncbi:MAG: hypothetical protein KAW92_09400 [Candidatus Cloacimonetes bacterium]|nr:hypothetical protein [Candidatus Cloacimonadota bacterium]
MKQIKVIIILFILLSLSSTLFSKSFEVKTDFTPINAEGRTSSSMIFKWNFHETIYTTCNLGFRLKGSSNWEENKLDLFTTSFAFDKLWNAFSWTNIEVGAGFIGSDSLKGANILVGHKFFPKYYIDDNDELTGWISPVFDIWITGILPFDNSNEKIINIQSDFSWISPIIINKSGKKKDLHLALFASAKLRNNENLKITDITLQNSGKAKIGIGFSPARYKNDELIFISQIGYMITPEDTKAKPFIEVKIEMGDIYSVLVDNF